MGYKQDYPVFLHIFLLSLEYVCRLLSLQNEDPGQSLQSDLSFIIRFQSSLSCKNQPGNGQQLFPISLIYLILKTSYLVILSCLRKNILSNGCKSSNCGEFYFFLYLGNQALTQSNPLTLLFPYLSADKHQKLVA